MGKRVSLETRIWDWFTVTVLVGLSGMVYYYVLPRYSWVWVVAGR